MNMTGTKPSVKLTVRGHEARLKPHKKLKAEDLFPGPLFIWNPSENYLLILLTQQPVAGHFEIIATFTILGMSP